MDSKELSVVKANRIVEAKYRLNVREQKFLLYMVSMIDADATDFKFQRVKISEFENVLNLEGKKWGSIYQVVRDIILSLNDKPLYINKEDGKKQIINWIASAEIETGSGVIEFEFSEKLKPYLLQLKSHFTMYRLDNVLHLKSGFSIRMYEILKANQFKGKVEYEVDELKDLLGVDNKYDEYHDFKKRVLNTAQQELKARSDIYFTFKEKRIERKIKSIMFQIFENTEGVQRPQKSVQVQSNQVIDKLVAIGYTKLKARKIFEKGFDNISDQARKQAAIAQFQNIEAFFQDRFEFLELSQRDGKVVNPQGFFLKSLSENYVSIAVTKAKNIKLTDDKIKQGVVQKDMLLAEYKKLISVIWLEKEAIIVKKIAEIPSDALERLMGSYDKTISPAANYERCTTPVRAKIVNFMEKHTPQYFVHLLEREASVELVKKQAMRL